MKYTLAIFDMDGTILYTLQDITDGLNYALRKNDLPEITLEKVRSFIGNGIMQEVIHSCPEGTGEAVIQQVYDDFNAYYAEHCSDNTHPYEGIPEILRDLRECGIKTAVVSNKGDYAVQELMDQYFEGLFDAGVGEKEHVRRKPAPDTVYEVLNQLDVPKENAVYIGDSEVDLETARNAGMDCIAVTYGYRDRDFLEEQGAEIIAESPEEVENIILKNNRDQTPPGMRWYNFLIWFGLYAGAVLNMLEGLRMITGKMYQISGYSPEKIYQVFPLLRYANIFFGICLFALGLFCVNVRISLRRFEKKGPAKYYILLIGINVIQIAGLVVYALLGKKYGVAVNNAGISDILMQAGAGLIVLAVSYIYFSNRKHLFTNE